ncbi:hypothetical protein [Paraburkholderia domus]|uniref:hypothetical protein n=1 Tax=Paraburkholderia domus TaxID=2793075 RepID=UPI001B0A6D56|nr:hypothetical protein [Paraburkholderia domus]CAE6851281.1 hypothetical protein R75483_07610 [Paraburkholderia domus]
MREASGASCIAFNAQAFSRDFPSLWANFGADEALAEQWLIEQTAFLTAGQFRHAQKVCVARRMPGPVRVGLSLRQARMGRSSVMECARSPQNILLETKGCGVCPGVVPTSEPYGNGLLALECGAKEYLLGAVLPQVIGAGKAWRFANVYGLILLDVQIQRGEGWHPAVVLVREASVRDPVSDLPLADSYEWSLTIDVELELRRIGLTSCFEDPICIERDLSGKLTTSRIVGEEALANTCVLAAILDQSRNPNSYLLDLINIQLNRSLQAKDEHVVVDFEHFKFVGDDRDHDVMTLCRDLALGFGGILPRQTLPPCRLPPQAMQTLTAEWERVACDAAMHPYLDRAGSLGAARYKQEIMKAYLKSLLLSGFSPLRESLRRIEQRWFAALSQGNPSAG